MARKEALGKGLSALIPPKKTISAKQHQVDGGMLEVEIGRITPSGVQPRKHFPESSLKELADSIRENGVIQPPIVRRSGNGTFELIAGERRWRASKIAGLKKIPVIVKDAAEAKALVLALIENIQREDLTPLETAEAFEHLIKDFNLTQEQMSQKVGKDRATVANYLRLLKLAPEVKGWLSEGLLSLGHAKALLSAPDDIAQVDIARHVIGKGLSVRETEAMVRRINKDVQKPVSPKKNPQIAALEDKLIRKLGTKVRLEDRGKKGGKIAIEYYSLDELDRLLDILLT